MNDKVNLAEVEAELKRQLKEQERTIRELRETVIKARVEKKIVAVTKAIGKNERLIELFADKENTLEIIEHAFTILLSSEKIIDIMYKACQDDVAQRIRNKQEAKSNIRKAKSKTKVSTNNQQKKNTIDALAESEPVEYNTNKVNMTVQINSLLA